MLCYTAAMIRHLNNLNQLLVARRELRNNATKEENAIWLRLKNKNLGFKFRRQHSIGKFILDFYCPIKKLGIEIDGRQHLSNKEYDKERNDYLNSFGVKIIRFSNDKINNDLDEVIMIIQEKLISL